MSRMWSNPEWLFRRVPRPVFFLFARCGQLEAVDSAKPACFESDPFALFDRLLRIEFRGNQWFGAGDVMMRAVVAGHKREGNS